MPVWTVYPHGGCGGVPPSSHHQPAEKRGNVSGWSYGSTRSNTRFLYSVRADSLTGWGYALTLTVRDCPDTHERWQGIRRAFFERLRRQGLVRAHWVTEWQRRGVPHLHCAVWLPEGAEDTLIARVRVRRALVDAWLAVAPSASAGGQHVVPITDSVGWFQYLSKHAARGVRHYQRCAANIPAGWHKTGRMWGYLGAWSRDEGMRLELSRPAWFALRRIVRGLMRADARRQGQRRRIRHTRRMLRCTSRELSEVRGLSEWLPMDTQLQAIHTLAAQGFEVHQV